MNELITYVGLDVHKETIAVAVAEEGKRGHGVLEVLEARKLKALKDLLGKKMVTPAARREVVAYLRSAHEMSQRRAIRVIGADKSAMRYRSTRPDDTALRDRLKSLALERRRFGYRRLHVLLRRDGHVVNRKRVQRLYREEKLTVRRRGGRKRALGEQRPLEKPTAANQRWSLDFVADQFTDGRRFRILEVYDPVPHEA